MDERTNALPIGTELEGYRIVALLGAGGFGITYKAVDVLLDRPVAIKEYLPSILANRSPDKRTVRPFGRREQEQFAWGLERFRTEAKTLVAFQHPNIVPVHRYFEACGTGYLVMSFQDGKSLADVLDAVGTLAEDEIVTILRPLSAGLADVHAKGFLHRDIKPANIVIRRDGTPVLIDFGAARQAVTRQSRGMTAIVTEGYAPYEQYETDSHQGPWTDIYALGAVLYHCVTGQRPPESPKRISAKLRKQPDPLIPARDAAAGRYGESLLAAIDRALTIEEAERPQTVRAFMAIVEGTALADDDPDSAAADLGAAEPPPVPLLSRSRTPTPPTRGDQPGDPLPAATSGAAGSGSPPARAPGQRLTGPGRTGRPTAAPAPAPGDTMIAGGQTLLVGTDDADASAPAAAPRKRRLVPVLAAAAALLVLAGVAVAYFGQRAPETRVAAPAQPTQPPPANSAPPEPADPPAATPKPEEAAAAKSRTAPPEIVWERTLPKPMQDVVRRIVTLPDDGMLVVGGRIDADASSSDVWQWRHNAKDGNSAGDRKSIPGTRIETGNAAARLTDGALALAAMRRNHSSNTVAAWVARVSTEGDVQWQHTFIERALTVPAAVTALPNGDIVVVGTATQDEKIGQQGWAARISADGKTVLWNRVFGKGPDDSLQAVAALPDGGVIAVGWTGVTHGQDEDSNLWIAAIDANGALRWEKRDLGDNADEKGKAVLVAEDGDIVVLAEARRARPQPPPARPGQPPPVLADSEPVNKPWVLRLAADGTLRWEKHYSGGKDDKSDSLDAIVPLGDGGFFLAGSTESKGAGRRDGWLMRIDAQGERLWDKEFGGAFDDEFTALTPLPDGGLLVAGATAAALDPPPAPQRTPPRGPIKTEPLQAEAKLWLLRLGYK